MLLICSQLNNANDLRQVHTGMFVSQISYKVKLEKISIPNTADLVIRSLLDKQQYYDPDGTAAKLGINSALWPIFGLLWPSSVYMAGQLALRPFSTTEKILEIGCGLGLPSLVYHRMGAQITASDCHPLAASFLQQNLRLNNLAPDLRYRHGRWGIDTPSAFEASHFQILKEQYDLIIGSDLLYDRRAPQALANFISVHAKPAASAWIIVANRGYRPEFNRCMAKHNFVLVEELKLSRKPCITGAKQYKGRLLKYQRDSAKLH